MPPAFTFRNRLEDYLARLAGGDLDGACRTHFAQEVRLVDNGATVARDRVSALRKLQPVARRFVMLRGAVEGLACQPARAQGAGSVRFVCRFEGVDVDGRLVRETVSYRQTWQEGRIVEEHQTRGAGIAPDTLDGIAPAPVHESASRTPGRAALRPRSRPLAGIAAQKIPA